LRYTPVAATGQEFLIIVSESGDRLIAIPLVEKIALSYYDWMYSEVPLDEYSPYVFVDIDYRDPVEILDVIVTNLSYIPEGTGPLIITLSGNDASSFELLTETIDNIDARSTQTFAVMPVDPLLPGTYTATVTVSHEDPSSSLEAVWFEISLIVTGDVVEVTLLVDPAGAAPLYYTITVNAGYALNEERYTGAFWVEKRETVSIRADEYDPLRYAFIQWQDGITTLSNSEWLDTGVTAYGSTAAFTAEFSVLQTANPGSGPYYITASSDPGSTISPNGSVPVQGGADKTFYFSAKSGYYISTVLVDGRQLSQAQIDSGMYTFLDVNMNHTIEVSSITDLRGDLTLRIDVVEGEGYAEFSINGSPFAEYTTVVNLPDFADIEVKAYAAEGYEFVKWETPAVMTSPEIVFNDNGASLHLELFFTDNGSGAGTDDGWVWWIALLLLLLLVGMLLWLIFFYRRYYDVIKPDPRVEGRDKVHRKSEYRFRVNGIAAVSYRIGEDGAWKPILPGPDGGYVIPKGEITDDVAIDLR